MTAARAPASNTRATGRPGATGSTTPAPGRSSPLGSAWLSRVRTWWQAQALRQQWLMLAALTVAGIGTTDALVLGPGDREQRALRAQLSTLQQQAARAQAEASRLADEQQVLRAQEAELRTRLAAADRAIASARTNIAGPAELRQRIRDLSQGGDVRLVALTTLPPEPVQVSPSAAGATAAAAAAVPLGAEAPATKAALFRYPIQVSVDGPYAALRDYLVRLEESDAGLRWHSVALDNRDWPAVRLEVRLFVLGDQPVWKGP